MSTDNISCKVVLVGDTGVGKTCIIQRYVNNNYEENVESTVASTYTYKVLNFPNYNKSISFDIWDTAGQEIYRALAKNFYLNAAIGVLVYDIKRQSSFDSIKNYWYDQLKESGEENMIFAVVGNKCDLFNEEEVDEEEAKKFAKSIGAIFKLTSCKESIGIDELFSECGKRYLEVNKLIGNEVKVKKDSGNIKLGGTNATNNVNNNNNKKMLLINKSIKNNIYISLVVLLSKLFFNKIFY